MSQPPQSRNRTILCALGHTKAVSPPIDIAAHDRFARLRYRTYPHEDNASSREH